MFEKTLVSINDRLVGDGEAVYIIAEIGINHNGSLEMAKKLIDGAVFAGCDAVKFQKRTPEICVPSEQRDLERDTPWGKMSYLEYRHRLEFNLDQYAEIDRYCREKGIHWFASCWDEPSVLFIEQFNPPLHKAASASLTDLGLIKLMRQTGKPLMLSTGMSTTAEIIAAIETVGRDNLLVAHSTSAYPCSVGQLNLLMISTLKERFPGICIGYSGHEVGLAPSLAAVAMGAHFIERHITFDRSMWGSDQAASVEIMGLHRLVRDIRDIEQALGDGIKKVYESELAALKKLRRVCTPELVEKSV
jgi:N-acetylneuraminate synthase